MWINVLRRIDEQWLRACATPAWEGRVRTLLELVEQTANLQAQPAATAAALGEALARFHDGRAELQPLIAALHNGTPLDAGGWMALAHLADVRELLESAWDALYEPDLRDFPELAAPMTELRAFLRDVPWQAGLRVLQGQWPAGDPDLCWGVAALLYLRGCAQMDALTDEPFYRETVSRLLRMDAPFLLAWLAGACLKSTGVAAMLQAERWEGAEYTSMMMLDNFSFLPGSAWG